MFRTYFKPKYNKRKHNKVSFLFTGSGILKLFNFSVRTVISFVFVITCSTYRFHWSILICRRQKYGDRVWLNRFTGPAEIVALKNWQLSTGNTWEFRCMLGKKEKSCIRETLNLSKCAVTSTNTKTERNTQKTDRNL